MPEISRFFGIVVRLFYDDHAPPHFHTEYGEYKATYSIKELQLLAGKLPRREEFLVLSWAKMHQDELLKDWDLCVNSKVPFKIEPLDRE